MRLRFFLSVLVVAASALAENSPTPAPTSSPSPSPRHPITIRLATPPEQGTVSLGIYNASGTLVRVLHREDAFSEFVEGENAIETTWDGKDDHGQDLPPGKYSARGFLIADLQVEGVDTFFNDWVTDEAAPHLAHISAIAAKEEKLRLTGVDEANQPIVCDFDLASEKLRSAALPPPAISPSQTPAPTPWQLPLDLVSSALGRNGTIWAVYHPAKDSPQIEVAQFAPAAAQGPGEALRKLSIPRGDPQPTAIAAAAGEDRIFLLEQAPGLQRVRSLTLVATASGSPGSEAVSDWRIDFEKKIVAHQNFTIVDGQPVVSPNVSGADHNSSVTQKLRSNPLQRDAPRSVDLSVGIDSDGSFLKAADGLPLRTISERAHLRRALIVRHAADSADVFQDDGAVVEQYRISNLDALFLLDGGEFELK